MKSIDDKTLMHMIEKKEIPPSLIESSDHVAVVLTQSWCPQWLAMRLWLKRLAKKHPHVHIYFLEYDKSPHFVPFMQFKEQHLGNDLVPYVRFFRKGEYQGDSNFCGEEHFKEVLGI